MEWISVNDRLPEVGKQVIAGGYCGDEWDQEVGFRSEVDSDLNYWVDFWFNVTHWMPLLEPPCK